MDNNQLYISSSNALMQARNAQSQISQKELEIRLLDINDRYNSNDPYSYSSNRIKRQNIKRDISNLESNRNMHLNYAIEYALMLAEHDITFNTSYSMATIAIGSINSFLSSQNINFRLSITSYMKISELSSKLSFSRIEHLNLKSEIDRLKTICSIY